MYKPVNIGTFGFFVEDGIDDFMFDFLGIVRTRHIHQMRGKFGNGTVRTQLLNLRNIIFESYEFNIAVFNFTRAVPDVHDRKQATSDDQGHKTAMRELFQVGKKEAEFNDQVNGQVEVD